MMLGAFGLQAQSSSSKSGSQSEMQQSGSQSKLSDADRDFLQKAYQANANEIQLAQMASQRASNNEVKQYAQKLVSDHTKAKNEIQRIAQEKGVDLSTARENTDQNKFSNLSGPAFDKEFIQEQMNAHQQAIDLHQQEAQNGKDPEIKSFASNQLGTLQQHEAMANNLQSSINSVDQNAAGKNESERQPQSLGRSDVGTTDESQSGMNQEPQSQDQQSSTSSSSSSTTTTNKTNVQSQDKDLPRTGSNLPLVGLFGLLLVGAVLTMRSFRLLRNVK
jgi:putative membrane protein